MKMINIILRSCVLVWLGLLFFVNCETAANVNDIIEWVISKGGFFSDKVEIRSTGDSFGVFAREDIDSKERLFEIPRTCYIGVTKIKKESFEDIDEIDWQTKDEIIMKNWHANYCRLAKKLINEMDLGVESEFGPYVEYLNFQKAGQTPATWSKEGKKLLRKLLPPGHDGVDWIDKNYKNTGCIERDDAKAELAVSLVLQRGYDLELIPIWDMVNHDNGRVNTEHNSIHKYDRLNVRASKKILAGEEIFATYDLCVDCGDMASYWGTTEILRDFGFVERYPQRWVFYHYSLYFELIEEDGELEVVWDNDDPKESWGLPDEDAVRFMRKYLKRIKQGSKLINDAYHKLPTSEIDIIMQYRQAAIVAFSQALESLKNYSKDTNDSTKENHDQSQGEL